MLVAGCAADGDRKQTAALKIARAAAVLRSAAADSAELLVRYDATAAAHAGLAARLKPLRAEVAHHLTAFDTALDTARETTFRDAKADGSPSGSASPSGSPSSSRSASPSALPSVPASEAAALAALAEAEQRLVDARTTALADAAPELARLLASVAAAGAGHVLLLKEK